jgi:hypothetical protein
VFEFYTTLNRGRRGPPGRAMKLGEPVERLAMSGPALPRATRARARQRQPPSGAIHARSTARGHPASRGASRTRSLAVRNGTEPRQPVISGGGAAFVISRS